MQTQLFNIWNDIKMTVKRSLNINYIYHNRFTYLNITKGISHFEVLRPKIGTTFYRPLDVSQIDTHHLPDFIILRIVDVGIM